MARDSEWIIPSSSDVIALDRALRDRIAGESWNRVRRLIESGKVRLDGQLVTDPRSKVRSGQTLTLSLSAPRAGRIGLPKDALVYVDPHLVVVEKPAHINTVPYQETERDTLDRLTADRLAQREHVRRAPLGIVQRLDRETTGLLVFARTLPSKRHLKNQFRFHTVDRGYYAIVQGIIESCTLSSRLVRDRGDGLRGSTENPKLGRASTTHVTVRQKLRGATLVECRLETGRTHQVRIHLAEAGHPLVGERVYVRDARGSLITAPRVLLHAFALGFTHPVTGLPLSFESPVPQDMLATIAQLRA